MSKRVTIKDLVPDDANFNTGNEFGNSLIDKSLSKFGAGRSILIDKNNRIIAGNKTIENAAANGFNDVVVVETTGDQIVAVKRTDIDLNTKKGREMALADNATAKANISWDAQALTDWDMPTAEWGIDLAEFAVEEVGEADAEPQIDKAAELNKKWKVKSGDLWQIGEHRLLCGDSTKDLDILLQGQEITLTVSSPPYFNQRQYSQWESYEDYCGFISLIAQQIGNHSSATSAIFWNVGMDGESGRDMPGDHSNLICSAGFKFIDSIAWVKESATWTNPRSQHISKGYYYPALQWEPCLVFYRDKLPSFEVTDASAVREYQTNVWALGKVIGSEQSATGHSAMFPTELATRAVRAYSKKYDVVYEPFAGSGTTLVACQNLNRKCYAIEISENYCAVILERMATAFPDIEIKKLDG